MNSTEPRAGLTLPDSRPLVLDMSETHHDEYGNCLPDICGCDYAVECREADPVPVCRNCDRAIWLHIYGGEGIWRHFTGLMLCVPDELSPLFTGMEVAEPSVPVGPD